MIKLIIICDIRLYREGLERSLGQRPEFQVVGTAAGESDALELVTRFRPELALVSVEGGSDLRLLTALRARAPQLKLVALSVAEQPEVVLRCVEAGASAYVGRDASLEELAVMLAGAARGEVVCSPAIAASLFQRVASLAGARQPAGPGSTLTEREREILQLIEQGSSNKEIARRLRVTVPTVKNHVHNILEKLGVSRRGAAAALARGELRQSLPAARATIPSRP